MAKAVIFDLDGTLWDATQIALPAFREVLTKLRLPVPPDDQLAHTLGYPLSEIWEMIIPKEHISLTAQANELMEDTELRLLRQSPVKPFPGVSETLAALRALGYSTFICSNCEPRYLESVPNHLKLGALFDARYSAGQYPGLTKVDLVRLIMSQYGVTAGFMVGDRFHDILAGHANGLLSIGCSFGTARANELRDADYIIDSFPKLLDIVAQFADVLTDK